MSTLLEVSGVSVSFDGFKAINNLSLTQTSITQISPITRMIFLVPLENLRLFCLSNFRTFTRTLYNPNNY